MASVRLRRCRSRRRRQLVFVVLIGLLCSGLANARALYRVAIDGAIALATDRQVLNASSDWIRVNWQHVHEPKDDDW